MWRVILTLVVLALTCSTASAQYEPFRLPESVEVRVAGERHRAFSLEGFKELLRMDADLRLHSTTIPGLEGQVDALERDVATLLEVADTRLQSIATLENERDRLQAMWEEENRLRLEAENSPDIGSWLGWGLAGAGGVAIVVLVIVMALGGSG